MGGGGKALSMIENLKEILDGYQIQARYNVMKKEIEISVPGTKFTKTNHTNASIGTLISLMHERKMPSGNIMDFLLAIADTNHYNPIKDWLDSRPWDGISRLKDFYDTIKSSNEELKEVLLKKWLVMAVAAAIEPDGVAARGVIVLQGAQYIGKTKWFKNLVPQNMSRYIRDGFALDLANKDDIMAATSYWLVELGELQHTVARSGVDALKAFIGRQSDTIRVPYGRLHSEYPRKTAFVGSVNEQNFLKDRTGNGRFFTIACSKIEHTHMLDMQQVWAEALVLYEEGESFYLSQDEMQELNDHNAGHETIEPLKEKILGGFEWDRFSMAVEPNQWLTTTEILEKIGWKKIDSSSATRAGIILKELTFSRFRTSSKGKLWGMPSNPYINLFS